MEKRERIGQRLEANMIPKLRIDTFNRTAVAALIGVGLFPPGLAIAQTRQRHEWCVNRR
jgi:hypothetical protein